MTKITIKKFVNEYNKRPIQTREKYLKDNLKIKTYIPFLTKNMLAEKLVNISTYRYENYEKEDGTIERRKTDTIQVNSAVQYLLFCRLIVENYTNLECETDNFYEEYDLLKSSGLLDILMVNTDEIKSLIPSDELNEFKAIIDMKKNDLFTNTCEIHNYISNLIKRFGDVSNVFLKPITEKLYELSLQLKTNYNMDTLNSTDFLEVKK